MTEYFQYSVQPIQQTKSKLFGDMVEVRDIPVDGETNWTWIKGDTGAFTGPKLDWETSHKTKYFEHVKKFDVIVTAGTNCGLYTRFYAKKFKHVYAFEPEPLAFYCMSINCEYENVVKLNAALGHGHGLVGINRARAGGDAENVGMNTVAPPSNQFKIPMVTVDSLVLDACDVIQLDVEGYEQYAIIGANETIKRFKPVIIAERFNSQANQDMMAELGYVLAGLSKMDSIYIPKEN